MALTAVGLGLLLFRLLIAARWVYRWPVRMLTRGNPWLSESIRAIVDGTGLRLTSASRSETDPAPLRALLETHCHQSV
ncbi:hypothetical protein [Micromonospora sp. NPDC050276]|uniref:hypothetical protein n=1 Tax=Micromonospora sp. NPDC050276 TaxID=3364278 RepID=UPI00379CDB2E